MFRCRGGGLSALGWPPVIYATAVCVHSRVVRLGGGRISLGRHRFFDSHMTRIVLDMDVECLRTRGRPH